MMENKDFERDEAKIDETKVMNRPEDAGEGDGMEDKAPKVTVRPKLKAIGDITKAVTRARAEGRVSGEMTPDEVTEAVVPVVDALYDAYEEDGTVPTREAFAERCASEDIGNVVLAMPRDPFTRTPISKGRVAAFCTGCVLVVALAGAGIALAVSSGGDTPPANVQAATTGAVEAEPEEVYVLPIGASAEGWDEATSSPVIVHVVSEEQDVDYYHAYSANEAARLTVPSEGEYQVSFISPVNADGSIYRVPDAQTVTSVVAEAGDGAETGLDGELPFVFEPVPAEDVTADELNSIMEQVTEAIKKGDETLTGEAGASVADTVKENCTANPNADTEAVEEEATKATEATQEGSSAQTGSTGGSSSTSSTGGSVSGGSGSGGSVSGGTSGGSTGGSSSNTGSSSGSGSSTGSGSSSGGSSSSQPSHTHNWVPVTTTVHHDAQYKTVHHDAQYKTVHHDAVTQNRSICNSCGADITGNESAHMKEYALKGDMTHSYSVKPVVVQAAYDEQVLVQAAYDEQVLVSAAWDETVTTGYKCSTCGATK